MNSIEFLKNQLSSIFKNFDIQKIEYEHVEKENLHLIKVNPSKILKDKDFAFANLDLDDKFYELFPEEEMIFLSSNSLTKLKKPSFTLSRNELNYKYKENFKDIFDHKFNSSLDNFILSLNDYDYIKAIYKKKVYKNLIHLEELENLNKTKVLLAGEENYALAA